MDKTNISTKAFTITNILIAVIVIMAICAITGILTGKKTVEPDTANVEVVVPQVVEAPVVPADGVPATVTEVKPLTEAIPASN